MAGTTFKTLAAAGFALAAAGCEPGNPPSAAGPAAETRTGPPAAAVVFTDVAAESGLSFRNLSGGVGQDLIVESMSAGAAFLDYDGDGWLDLLAVNGTSPGASPGEGRNRLFRNEQDGPDQTLRRFREVTGGTGLGSPEWGMGCAVGDYDNDADPDIYLTYWGPNQLLRNDGDGVFADVTASAGTGDPGWGTSAAFGDLDNDGLLDLYIVNYLEFDFEDPPAGGRKRRYKGLEVFYGPMGIPAQADRLYRNRGDAFVDVSAETGIAGRPLPGLGVALGDFDGDGDLDIYVANDSEPNQMYRNDGAWRFAETGTASRVAFTEDGRPQAGMGVHGGDYDNDGDLDLFVTNFSEDVNTLYRNDGDWLFADATSRAGLDGVVRPFLGFGTGFFDCDNDGWLDIFVANGHLYPQLEQLSSGLRYRQRNLLYRNAGGRFLEVGAAAGPGLSAAAVSRAAAFGDYDNDGDVDLFVANLNEEPALLRNDGGNSNSWIGLDLEGGESNRDAIGASVRVSAGSLVQMREVHRGYGFQAQHDPRLLFGLGDSREPPRVEIRWPSGKRQVFENLPLRRYVAIREGVDGFVAGPGREPVAAAGSPGPVPAEPVAREPIAAAGSPGPAPPEPGAPEKEPFPSLQAASAPAPASPDSPAAAPGLDPAAQQFYREARAHYSEGRLSEAAEALEQAVRADPEGDRAFLLLGKTFLNLNRDGEAVAALEKAHALDPGNWEYSNLLGVAYKRAGRMDEAFDAFSTAARNAPWAPRPHLNLARMYDEAGQSGSAEVERRLFEQWRPLQREAEIAGDMVKSNPDDPRGRRHLGLAYARQGRHADALAEFRRACDLDPDDGMARYGLGEALHREKRYAEAVESYEQALELVPGDAAVRTGLGRSLAALGRFEAAAEQFQRALASDPDHAAAHLGLGELALKQRDEAAAVRACGRALQHQPGLALAHSCLGSAHAAAGRYDAAAAALERALELDARLVQTRYALGLVHHLQGRYPQAVGEWKRVLLLAPGHVKARQGIALAKRKSEAPR